jgi:hypothetical protein
MQEHNPWRKLTLRKAESTRRVGRRAVRWLDSVEEDLKAMSVRNWRRKWQAIVKEDKILHELWGPKKKKKKKKKVKRT